MAAPTTPRTPRAKDLRGIRQRGRSYQVRVFSGRDPLTGDAVYLTGSAQSERDAIRLRDRLRAEVAESRSSRTNGTVGHLLAEWLDRHSGEAETVEDYRSLTTSFIEPALGTLRLTRLTQPGPSPIDKFYAELRRCRRRCDGKPFIEHWKACRHETDPLIICGKRCRPHVCKPLSGSTMRHIHVVLNGAFKSAVKWGWMGVNPLDVVTKPRAPKPQPNPPSAANAARIIEKAWTLEPEWGTFVWLTMVTGARRGELVALRFASIELSCSRCSRPVRWNDSACRLCDADLDQHRTGMLEFRRNYSARRKIEKDTKTHQIRRISIDATTTSILVAQFDRYEERMQRLGAPVREDAYLFSYAPDNSRPCNPDGLTHRYSRMTASLGLDTHIHELRHYSATELLAAGVDLRTVTFPRFLGHLI